MDDSPFTEEEIKAMQDTFSFFDKDGNNSIDSTELCSMMQCIGQNPTQKEVDGMMKEFDIDENGTIEFNEFLQLAKNSNFRSGGSTSEDMTDAFQVFDKDGNGFISEEELKQAMTTLGETMTDEEVHELLLLADKDKDGQINYKEFVSMMVQT